MRGFRAFLAKEFAEIGSTWRIWVLPVILLFFGFSSPILARITPDLLASLVPPGSGVEIKFPPPTAGDAYAQFLKNLGQMTSLAIVFATAGILSAEIASGTAVLVLTKPVSRRAFVVAKALSSAALLAASTLLGAAVCAATTDLVFGAGQHGAFMRGVGLWLAFGLVLTTAMLFISSTVDSQAAASGIGLGAFFIASLASIWQPARHWSFVGLLASSGDIMAGKTADVTWQLGTAALACVAFTALAVWRFERREL